MRTAGGRGGGDVGVCACECGWYEGVGACMCVSMYI